MLTNQNKPPKILALCGRRFSGKSYLADMAMRKEKRFVRRAFADNLKKRFAEAYDIPLQYLHTTGVKDKYREPMFMYANSCKREDPCCFARPVIKASEKDELTIIDDLRFIEELQLIIESGGVVVKVVSEPIDRKSRGWIYSYEIDEDYSETEMDLSIETFLAITSGRAEQVFNNLKSRETPDEQISAILRQWFPKPIEEHIEDLKKQAEANTVKKESPGHDPQYDNFGYPFS